MSIWCKKTGLGAWCGAQTLPSLGRTSVAGIAYLLMGYHTRRGDPDSISSPPLLLIPLWFFLYIFCCGTAKHRIFTAECGIFICGMQTLSCGMWDLVPWPGIGPSPPALGVWSFSHWTTREVPIVIQNTTASGDCYQSKGPGSSTDAKGLDSFCYLSKW